MMLHDVHRGIKKFKKRKRVGRGPGSGHGKTSTRGHKGQGARAGWTQSEVFEGGKMPLVRRIPKRGFNNRWAKRVLVLNVSDLEQLFAAGDEVTPEKLRELGPAKRPHDVIKILGDGELSKKLTVSAHQFSKSAQEKIAKAGGKVNVLPGPAPVVKNKQRSSN